jgi:3-phenylpropionate/trans-cinnamate dioxygenase ferredoxin component
LSGALMWKLACNADDVEEEDVLRFDSGDAVFAIYKIREGIFATDGHCTHEQALLSDGFVMDNVIECPLHQGRFDIRTGKALSGPVCVNLRTYPVRIEEGKVFIGLPAP